MGEKGQKSTSNKRRIKKNQVPKSGKEKDKPSNENY